MPPSLGLSVEVIGCPTVCRHCWAQGVPYRAMPLADVALVLEEAHRFADANGLTLAAYPMHEVAAHPQAAALLRLFAAHVGAAEFEPLATTGVPLARRDDWRELLETAAALGTTTVWVALHGAPEEHDRMVGRAGAFVETRLGVERARAAGMRVGANVFLTRPSLARLDAFVAAVESLRLDEALWSVAGCIVHGRGRRYEALRPELADLAPHAERLGRLSAFWRRLWAGLDDLTEASYVRRALDGEWPAAPAEPAGSVGLVVRPNLDLHSGTAGLYGPGHGNLRPDGAVAFERALDHGPVPHEAIQLRGAPVPPLAELAGRFGDPAGRALHFYPHSARNRWLMRAAERARAA
jgi:hypothetical protein